MKDTKVLLKQIYNKHKIIRFIEMVIGISMAAIAFNLFILPFNLVIGGVSGISIIIRKYFDMAPATFIFISSAFLLLISFIFLGREKTRGSILGSIFFPIMVKITEGLSTYFVLDKSDQLLLAIFGGVIYGFGMGLVFKAGYTSGGTDILNQIVSKYGKTTIGNAMLIVDGLIVLIGGFIFGWTKFMYAIIILYIISIMTDRVLLGISDSKAFYIITNKEKEVSEFIIDELEHSVTVLDAKGGYTKKKNPVLFTVIPTKEYFKFKEGLHIIDEEAFFTVVDAYEVLGGE